MAFLHLAAPCRNVLVTSTLKLMSTISATFAVLGGLILWALMLMVASGFGRVGPSELAAMAGPVVAAFIFNDRRCDSAASGLWAFALTPLVIVANFFVAFVPLRAVATTVVSSPRAAEWLAVGVSGGALVVLAALLPRTRSHNEAEHVGDL